MSKRMVLHMNHETLHMFRQVQDSGGRYLLPPPGSGGCVGVLGAVWPIVENELVPDAHVVILEVETDD